MKQTKTFGKHIIANTHTHTHGHARAKWSAPAALLKRGDTGGGGGMLAASTLSFSDLSFSAPFSASLQSEKTFPTDFGAASEPDEDPASEAMVRRIKKNYYISLS